MNITKKCILLVILHIFMLLMGCSSTNYYATNYVEKNQVEFVSSDKNPILMEYLGPFQKDQLLEDGYIEIGSSSFNNTYTPRAFIVECARQKGADIVLCKTTFDRIVEGNYIDYVPTISTSYTRGDIYGTYGNYASYNSKNTSYGAIPFVQTYSLIYFNHYAWFYSKRKFSNTFGVYITTPLSTPGKKFKVYIDSIIPNSTADKLGYKEGQAIKSINGKKIKSKKDVMPYITGKIDIKKMEVEE